MSSHQHYPNESPERVDSMVRRLNPPQGLQNLATVLDTLHRSHELRNLAAGLGRLNRSQGLRNLAAVIDRLNRSQELRNSLYAFGNFIDKDVSACLELLSLLQKGAHSVESPYSPNQGAAIEMRSEDTLRFLLRMHNL